MGDQRHVWGASDPGLRLPQGVMEPRVFPKGLWNMPGAWADDAACVEAPPGAMYPTDGAGVEAAKAWCRACPVRDECLEWALEHNEVDGVWGGESERSRRRIRRQRILVGSLKVAPAPREDLADAL